MESTELPEIPSSVALVDATTTDDEQQHPLSLVDTMEAIGCGRSCPGDSSDRCSVDDSINGNVHQLHITTYLSMRMEYHQSARGNDHNNYFHRSGDRVYWLGIPQ